MRLFDRASRRAAVPVAVDESPYRSHPLMVVAAPLPLGATGAQELLEVYLTRKCDPQKVSRRHCCRLSCAKASCTVVKPGQECSYILFLQDQPGSYG